MTIPPWVSKYRDRKAGRTYLLAGHDAFSDTNARSQARHAFDANIVANWDVIETLLDYCFLKLGIDEEGTIGHPVVMTEALCNPNYCRKSTFFFTTN
jgi:actin-related protein 5